MTVMKRLRQTRTPVHNRTEDAKNRARGVRSAYRLTAAVQMLTQLMLWITLYAYEQTVQTVWQSALMLLLPLLVLLFVWRMGAPAVGTKAARRWGLLLLPCLMTDAALTLRALSGYIGQLMPTFPYAACVLIPAAVCVLCVFFARENGVAYGTFALRMLLGLLFLLSTVFQLTNTYPARLWPLMGLGLGQTAVTALSGAGCVWGAALLYLLPSRAPEERFPAPRDTPRAALWAFLPWALAVIWALWHGMVRPWRLGDTLAIGEKLMGIARHARSAFLYELTGLWWMLLLPISLTASLSSGEKLLTAAAPKLPRFLCALVVMLPALLGALLWQREWLAYLGHALPWRAVLSLIGGAGMAVAARKEKRA